MDAVTRQMQSAEKAQAALALARAAEQQAADAKQRAEKENFVVQKASADAVSAQQEAQRIAMMREDFERKIALEEAVRLSRFFL